MPFGSSSSVTTKNSLVVDLWLLTMMTLFSEPNLEHTICIVEKQENYMFEIEMSRDPGCSTGVSTAFLKSHHKLVILGLGG